MGLDKSASSPERVREHGGNSHESRRTLGLEPTAETRPQCSVPQPESPHLVSGVLLTHPTGLLGGTESAL